MYSSSFISCDCAVPESELRGTVHVSMAIFSNHMEELADGRTAHAQQGTDKRHNPVVTFSWGALPFNESQFNRNTQRSVCLGGASWWALNCSTLVTRWHHLLSHTFQLLMYLTENKSITVLSCHNEKGNCFFIILIFAFFTFHKPDTLKNSFHLDKMCICKDNRLPLRVCT